MIGVWAGLTLDGTVIAQDELAPYVQDALDLVEYVTGPVTSRWGARRAADGHPHPFRIPYLEIGNEDFLNGGTASYDAYRYPMFYDAIKGAYPQVPLVATTSVTSRPMDVLDLHFYSDAAFFEQASTMFDSYSRGEPLIFVGEYSATANAGPLPTGLLGNSAGEAAFMRERPVLLGDDRQPVGPGLPEGRQPGRGHDRSAGLRRPQRVRRER